jgi:hypothetical protein
MERQEFAPAPRAAMACCTAEHGDELASSYVGHGLIPRNPLCQLSACSGCPGSARRSLGRPELF